MNSRDDSSRPVLEQPGLSASYLPPNPGGTLEDRLDAWLDMPSSSWTPWLVAAFAATGLALTLLRLEGPTVFADEYGYLGIGRWLVGEGTHPSVSVEPGLGMLYAPIFWLTGSSSAAHQVALALNAVILGGAYVLLARALAGRNGMVKRGDLVAAGVIAFIQYTWFAHVAMVPTVLLLVTAVGFWAFRRVQATGLYVAAMFVLGLSIVFHRRALILVPAALIASAAGRRGGTPLRAFLMTAGSSGLGLVLAQVVIRWDHSVGGRASSLEDSPELFTGFLDALGQLLVHLATHASYEILASASLIVVGAGATVRFLLRSEHEGREGHVFAVLLPAFAIVAVAVRTATFNEQVGLQLRDLFFGRFLSAFSLPLVAVGATYLLRIRRRDQLLAIAVVAVGAISGLVIALVPGWVGAGFAHASDFDGPAIAVFQDLAPSRYAQLALAGMYSFIFSVIIGAVLLRDRSGALSVIVLVLLAVLAVPTVYTPPFVRASQVIASQGVPARHLAAVAEQDDCVYIHAKSLQKTPTSSPRFPFLYRWYFPGEAVEPEAEEWCQWALTGDPDFRATHPGWVRIVEDPTSPDRALWKRTGPQGEN